MIVDYLAVYFICIHMQICIYMDISQNNVHRRGSLGSDIHYLYICWVHRSPETLAVVQRGWIADKFFRADKGPHKHGTCFGFLCDVRSTVLGGSGCQASMSIFRLCPLKNAFPLLGFIVNVWKVILEKDSLIVESHWTQQSI